MTPGREGPSSVHDPACSGGPDPAVVNGVRIDPLSSGAFLARLEAFLRCGRSHVFHFCAAHPTVEARSNAAYRALLNGGDLNLPDGMPVAWAARLQGRPARRLAGSDAMRLTAAWGIERGLGHYLFGTTEPTLERLRAGLERAHPGISIVGTESPPFRPQSDEELRASVERMRAAGADVVWVGLGAPKQDVVGERLRALDAAPVIMCVGAAFDFVSGVKRRAPRWLQRLGLEWAFRLAAEPRRLWRRYLIGNVRFVAGILADRAAAGRAGLGGGDEAR